MNAFKKVNFRTFPPKMLFDYRKNHELREHIRIIYLWKNHMEKQLEEQLKNVEELGGSMGEKMLIHELLGLGSPKK